MALTNNVRFSSSTGKRYSCSDTCKNKPSVSFAVPLNEADFFPLSPPVHTRKCKHSSSSNNCNRDLCETHGSNYVSSASKSVSTKTVCKLVRMESCNKPAIFLQFTSLFTLVVFVIVKLLVAVLAVNL